MILKNWIRIDGRTLANYIDGKLSEREQALFRQYDHQKGAYEFKYSHQTGRTTIIVTEHPEWP